MGFLIKLSLRCDAIFGFHSSPHEPIQLFIYSRRSARILLNYVFLVSLAAPIRVFARFGLDDGKEILRPQLFYVNILR